MHDFLKNRKNLVLSYRWKNKIKVTCGGIAPGKIRLPVQKRELAIDFLRGLPYINEGRKRRVKRIEEWPRFSRKFASIFPNPRSKIFALKSPRHRRLIVKISLVLYVVFERFVSIYGVASHQRNHRSIDSHFTLEHRYDSFELSVNHRCMRNQMYLWRHFNVQLVHRI